MITILKKLLALFQSVPVSPEEDAWIDALLQKDFQRLRDQDVETKQQWLRLQHAIARDPVRETPRTFRLKPVLTAGIPAIAGAIGIFLVITLLLPSRETFTTHRGEQEEVVLADGSQVILHYASELAVLEMDGDNRRLALDGEAYFRVERNGIPFIVSTGNADVAVVGTEFNVRKRGGSLEVAVIGGTVNVTVTRDGVDSTVQLTRNQKIFCAENSYPGRIESIPFPEYPGWLHGKLYLDKTSFAAACREIEMRFDVSIQVHEKNLRSRAITGILDAKTPESAVTALCELTGTRHSYDGQKYRIR